MNEYEYGEIRESDLPEIYRPLTMWEYFGYQILYAIPIVGWIFLLIHAFGTTKNKNLKNFARSYFCYFIILLAIALIIFAVFGAASVGSWLGGLVGGNGGMHSV